MCNTFTWSIQLGACKALLEIAQWFNLSPFSFLHLSLFLWEHFLTTALVTKASYVTYSGLISLLLTPLLHAPCRLQLQVANV